MKHNGKSGGSTLDGLRFTPQRRHVYHILLQARDHPDANEVYLRAKKGMPEISLATVYNCLEALTERGLARQVHVDRTATRYCPNLEQHCHFYCEECRGIFDIDYDTAGLRAQIVMPKEFSLQQCEIALRGQCADCATKAKRKPARAARQRT